MEKHTIMEGRSDWRRKMLTYGSWEVKEEEGRRPGSHSILQGFATNDLLKVLPLSNSATG
jgi:hypothetical protein